ncbi:MAG: AIR synthase related protein, partial [Acidimicrobiales bacterium]
TVLAPWAGAAVLRLKAPGVNATASDPLGTAGQESALALSTDGNARWCAVDPRVGTAWLVAESALNVACAGAVPVALVNCLNFGNPEHPEVMWQLSETVDGIGEACRALGLPVVGGNVSLYNESNGSDIDPTPVIGVLGLIERLLRRPPGVDLTDDAALVLLDASVGATTGQLGPPPLAGSRWAVERRGHRNGALPALDLPGHARLVDLVRGLVAEGVAGGDPLLGGIHDISGGGLGVALAELAVRAGIGLQVAGVADHHELFTEAPSRVVVCTTRCREVVSRAADAGVGFRVLGQAGGDRIVVEGLVDLSVSEATRAWRDRLPDLLDELAPAVMD